MNTFKTVALVVVMAAVAYGVYASLNKKPPADPPALLPEDWAAGPQVDLRGATPAAQGSIPNFIPGSASAPSPSAPGIEGLQAQTTPPASLLAATGPAAASPGAASFPATAALPQPGATLSAAGTRQPPTEAAAAVPVMPGVGQAASPPATSQASPPPVQAQYGTSPLSASPVGPLVSLPEVRPAGSDTAAAAFPAQGAAAGEPSRLPADGGFALAADDEAAEAEPAATEAPDIHPQFVEAMEIAQSELARGRLTDVHLGLSMWYDHPHLAPADQQQLVDLLDRLAGTVIYSHQHHLVEPAYDVQPGDTLPRLAETYRVPAQLLANINGLDPAAPLTPGQVLKVVRGPFDAVVDAKNSRLTLFLQGRYAGRFQATSGAQLAAGDYEVQRILAEPSGYATLIGGDQAGPPGSYIDLGDGVRIEATGQGQAAAPPSQASIAVGPADLGYLAEILSVGSKVVVRR